MICDRELDKRKQLGMILDSRLLEKSAIASRSVRRKAYRKKKQNTQRISRRENSPPPSTPTPTSTSPPHPSRMLPEMQFIRRHLSFSPQGSGNTLVPELFMRLQLEWTTDVCLPFRIQGNEIRRHGISTSAYPSFRARRCDMKAGIVHASGRG